MSSVVQNYEVQSATQTASAVHSSSHEQLRARFNSGIMGNNGSWKTPAAVTQDNTLPLHGLSFFFYFNQTFEVDEVCFRSTSC